MALFDKPVTIKISQEALDRIDHLANTLEVSRHQVAKNLITTGLDDVKTFERLGFLRIALALRDIQKPQEGNSFLGEVPLTVRLDLDNLGQLDKFSDRFDLNRQQLLRNLLKVGVEEAETLADLKQLKLSGFILRMKEKFTALVKAGEQAARVSKS